MKSINLKTVNIIKKQAGGSSFTVMSIIHLVV